MEQLSVNKNKNKQRSKQTFQLNLCTKGHCLLCLKRPTTTLSNATKNYVEGSETEDEEDDKDIKQVKEWIRFSSLSNSLQNLCKYLKVDVVKLVKENIKIPGMAGTMGMGSSKEKAKMTNVFLCGKCEAITESFSSLFQNLERIQMEMDHCLEVIHQSISEAEGDPELAEAYQESMSTDFYSMIMAGLIGEMKKEISNKCSETRFSKQTSKVCLNMVFQALPKMVSRAKVEEENEMQEEDSDSDASLFNVIPEDEKLNNRMAPSAALPTKNKTAANIKRATAVRTSYGRQVHLSEKAQVNLNAKNDDADSASEEDDKDEDMDSKDTEASFDNEKNTGMFKCRKPSCLQLFPNRSLEFQHFQRQHKGQTVNSEQSKASMISVQKQSGLRRQGPEMKMNKRTVKYTFDEQAKKFRCNVASCAKFSETKKAASSHHWAAHVRWSNDNKNYKNAIKLRQPREQSNPRRFRSLPEYYVLDKGTRKYKCSYGECTSKFTSRQNANLHYQSQHLKIRHLCEICKAPFVCVQYMRKHMKTCKGSAKEIFQQQQQQETSNTNVEDDFIAEDRHEIILPQLQEEQQQSPEEPEMDKKVDQGSIEVEVSKDIFLMHTIKK